MRIYKIAATPDQNSRKIDKIEQDIKDLKKDIREMKSDIKKVNGQLDSLNLGQRRMWEQKTVFTSIQRKLERFEKIEDEWKKYKNEMDDKVRKEVEKRTKATIKV